MHGAGAHNMNVQMGNGFSSIWAVIDHDAVAVLTEAFLTSRRCGGRKQGSEECGIGGSRLIDPGDAALGDYEKVDGCLRSNITKGDPLITLCDNGGRYLSCGDLLEKRHG